jgi:hypothetical protein
MQTPTTTPKRTLDQMSDEFQELFHATLAGALFQNLAKEPTTPETPEKAKLVAKIAEHRARVTRFTSGEDGVYISALQHAEYLAAHPGVISIDEVAAIWTATDAGTASA